MRAVRDIIKRRVQANKVEHEKAEVVGSPGTGAGPESTAEGGAKATGGSSFAEFAKVMVANGFHFDKPIFGLAGDLWASKPRSPS